MPERLLGDFALALLDPQAGSLLLARDPLGVKPLYYCLQPGGLSFATSVAALRALPNLNLTPDEDWMARYLAGLSQSDTDTGYREIRKLPPAHALTIGADGQLKRWRHHHWRDDAPSAGRRDPRWVEAYRAVLEEAIRCRMDSDFPLGTENSGGLDSAAITAYLAHFLGQPGDRLHSFGFALCEQEPAFILETSQAKRIRHNYILTDHYGPEDNEARIDRALTVLGYPEEHGNGSGHIPFYQECERRAIRTLFSGFGGDEVVTNPGQLLRYELLDRHAYAELWDILPGNPVWRALRLGKAATIGRRSPAYRPTFLAAWNARWPHQLLRTEVVERLDLHHEYLETARYDAPYRRINAFILDGLLPMPYIATRLENGTLMAASHGIDYRWPLWDVRLVQQYLSTPSIEKVGPNGIGRYLHRRAIDGVVPKRVAWKPSKDMGYGALIDSHQGAGLIPVAAAARGLEADLHPTLVDLIDRPKLRRQIDQAETGLVQDDGLAFALRRGVGALRWLDRWLKGHAA
jgi:asparagine synthase (glutamine-hydrolysing)